VHCLHHRGNKTFYSNTKRPKVLFCYNFVNKIINEKEDVLLVAKPNLFVIGTITLPKLKILLAMVVDAKIGTNAKIGSDMKIDINKLIFYFLRTLGKISVDTTPIQIKVHDMKIAKWNLS
jgi:hypothetical protein